MKRIKEVVATVAPQSEVYLFGSRARKTAAKQSDWDILILVNTPKIGADLERRLMDELYEIEIETGAVISPLIYTRKEWDKRFYFTPLFKNIEREGLRIG